MFLLSLLACASTTPAPPAVDPPVAVAPVAPPAPSEPAAAPPAATPPAGDTVTAPTLLGPAPGVAFLGNWTSAACGGRAYARNIHFEEDQTYAGIDLVSPCPVGASCIWSGMTGYAGIWVQNGKEVSLREIGAPTTEGGPHPTKFEATADGKLVENGCFYTRGLTVPKGYEESRVTPHAPGTPAPGQGPAAPAATPPKN